MEQKLYLVEFGEPDEPGFYSSNSERLYIIAETYNQAAGKALKFRENESSVVDRDGSLKSKSYGIKAIKLITEKVII